MLRFKMLCALIFALTCSQALACNATLTKTWFDTQSALPQPHLVIPAGQILLAHELALKPGTRVSGPGTVCVPKGARYGFRIQQRVINNQHRGSSDIIIDNLRFQHENAAPTAQGMICTIAIDPGAQDIRITNSSFNGNRAHSVICGPSSPDGIARGPSVDYLHIANSTFHGSIRPLLLDNIANFTIRGNVIRHAGREGIKMRYNAGHGIISDNLFHDIGKNPGERASQDAIDTYWSGQRLLITNNIIRRTASHGLDIKGISDDGASGSRSVIIANNHFSETGASGITLSGLGGLYLLDEDGNPLVNDDDSAQQIEFTGTPNHSILIQGNIIENGNRFGTRAHAGIYAFSGNLRHITIADNFITNHRGHGIYIKTRGGQPDQTVAFTKITGNSILNSGEPGSRNGIGIYMQGASQMMIVDNTIGNDPALAMEFTGEDFTDALRMGTGMLISPIYAMEQANIITRNMIFCTPRAAIRYTDGASNNVDYLGDNLVVPMDCEP